MQEEQSSEDKNNMSMQVTDFRWVRKNSKGIKEHRKGFYMDEFLGTNLMKIPKFLRKSWDTVGIISGHGKVRIGKSTMAQQIGYFIAWLLAGGDMDKDEKTKRWYVYKKPTKEVRFNLEENIVFGPQELMDKAAALYKKYGKHQVIIYDEGRAGLDSARAMAAINKIMQDFFQECGVYGHVILIVLPNYFKLHEDYAVVRSLFLIDVYADVNMNRGFFSFYNERQKEFLYYQGKKKIGTLKYQGVHPSFTGRFTKFLPLDDEEYNEAKMRAIKKKELAKTERKWKHQRDVLIYLVKSHGIMTYEQLAKQMTIICGTSITIPMLENGNRNITKEMGDEEDSD